MQNGYVVLNTIVLLLIGVAGAGKTSFCHMLFGEPPPVVRKSTPLAQSSIRAVSFSRATVSLMRENALLWKRVTSQMLSSLIADGIKNVTEAFSTPKPKIESTSSQTSTRDQSLFISPKSTRRTTEQNVIALPSFSTGTSTYRPLSDIDRLFEMKPVKQLLELVSQSKGSIEIFRKAWVYVCDSGGQLQFHELLPTFVHHVSAVAFFVKLNEKLETRPMIEYFSKDGVSVCDPYQSPQTNMQIIQNCLQAMQTRCVMEGSAECPELFFIGTHHDLENKEEPLESKNGQFIRLLSQHDTFSKHLAYYSLGSEDQLIFPVNAATPSTEDKKVVEKFRQSVMDGCRKQQREIPIRWFVLESLLQELCQNGVISFAKCLEVASRLGMDADRLRAAIDYLVHLNMFEFFPEILPTIVFTTSQVLLTKITELIEYSHVLRNESTSACTSEDREFRDNGCISEKFLKQKRFSSHFVDGLFEANHFLILLENRLVITRRDDIFIMMPVLPQLPPKSLEEHRLAVSQYSTHVPIAVHYPGSLFPIGIFTSLVSHLQTESHWMVLTNVQTGKPECLYKNCVDFVITTEEVEANVTLIYTHEWIEVHVCICDEPQQACSIEKMLFDGLKCAGEVQKYSHIVPKLAFFCPGVKGISRLPVKCELPFPHLATVTPNARNIRCNENKQMCYKLTEKHSLWIGFSKGNVYNSHVS